MIAGRKGTWRMAGNRSVLFFPGGADVVMTHPANEPALPLRALGALVLLGCLSGCYYYGGPYGYRQGYYSQPYSSYQGNYYSPPGYYGNPPYGGYSGQPGYGGGYLNQPGYGAGYSGPPDDGGNGYGQSYGRGNSHTLPYLPYYGDEAN
jgi:hypothetical protein